MTRAEAISAGLKRYSTGRPCVHGHTAERRVQDARCILCVKRRSVGKPHTAQREWERRTLADPVKGPVFRARKAREKASAREKHPAHYLWLHAKYRAKKRGLQFGLRKDDIVIPDRCPVLGVLLERGSVRRHDASPTLDRINPARGYVRGNVAVISWRANRLKSDAGISELRAILAWLEKP